MKSLARVASFALSTALAGSCFADDVGTPARTSPAPAADAAAVATAERQLPFVAAALHLGLLPYGRGEEKNGCSGQCMGFAPANASYAHGVAFGVGADALFTFLDVLRVGPSLFYTLPNHVDIAGGKSSFGIGSDLKLALALEAAPKVVRNLRFVPRVQGGMTVLFAASDLQQTLDVLKPFCGPTEARGCDGLSGAHVGWNVGAGVGALYFSTDHVRLRADVLVEYYAVHLYDISAKLFTNPIDVSETLSGGRSFILLGAEY